MVVVNVQFYQYYIEPLQSEFDPAATDALQDGIIAPDQDGIRVRTGTHAGQLELEVVIEGSRIEVADLAGTVSSACNLRLPDGVLAVRSFDGDDVLVHDFGRPITCALVVTVFGRDIAAKENYLSERTVPERHKIAVSEAQFSFERWRSEEIDTVGSRAEVYTQHIGTPVQRHVTNAFARSTAEEGDGVIVDSATTKAVDRKQGMPVAAADALSDLIRYDPGFADALLHCDVDSLREVSAECLRRAFLPLSYDREWAEVGAAVLRGEDPPLPSQPDGGDSYARSVRNRARNVVAAVREPSAQDSAVMAVWSLSARSPDTLRSVVGGLRGRFNFL